MSFLSVLFFATAASALDLSFAWDANRDPVDGYRVYCREEGEPYDYEVPAWEDSETTCTIFDLEDGGVYYFLVRAYNAYGESRNSVELRYPPLASSGSSGGGGGCMISSSACGLHIGPVLFSLKSVSR